MLPFYTKRALMNAAINGLTALCAAQQPTTSKQASQQALETSTFSAGRKESAFPGKHGCLRCFLVVFVLGPHPICRSPHQFPSNKCGVQEVQPAPFCFSWGTRDRPADAIPGPSTYSGVEPKVVGFRLRYPLSAGAERQRGSGIGDGRLRNCLCGQFPALGSTKAGEWCTDARCSELFRCFTNAGPMAGPSESWTPHLQPAGHLVENGGSGDRSQKPVDVIYADEMLVAIGKTPEVSTEQALQSLANQLKARDPLLQHELRAG